MHIHALTAFLRLLLPPAVMIDPCDSSYTSEGAVGKTWCGECLLVTMFFAAMLFLRIAYVFHYPIDSDEPQHLHVVWGWAHGLLQYRDIFDNHTPLFHLLCTPLFLAFGERPEVLYLMRLAMIPCSILVLWSTYKIGCVLFSRRVGLWAVVFVGLLPGLFFCSVEFRADDLWTALWLLALGVFIQGRLTWRRSLVVGLILGAAMGVSMKTTLLLASFGSAVLTAGLLTAKNRSLLVARHLSLCAAAALAGLSLVPIALALFFATQGAFASFFYGTVQHNILPGLGRWKHLQQSLLFPMTLPALWWGARTIVRRTSDAGLAARRVVIFLTAAVYISALFSFWPLLTREDYLPFYPLFVLLLTPGVLAVPSRIAHWRGESLSFPPRYSVLALTFVAILEIGCLVIEGSLWRDHTSDATDLLAEVLRLTQPTDPVVDLKGETVFRPRSSYYVLEGITRARIGRGLIADDIPERLIATRTCVAAMDNDRFPPRTRTFLQENYLRVGRLRVAGQFLTPQGVNDGTYAFPFTVQIPTQYVIVSETGAATGWLDGVPYQGMRFLTSGLHEYRSSLSESRLALVWAQAVERGFSPFLMQRESR
ncbi:MAG TPA: glycosyltransferase family 39 protein [Candidatus Binatia bacterium]|nr:glycosyltransferase family 39 protein [Candidatus Binatia bacterium]